MNEKEVLLKFYQLHGFFWLRKVIPVEEILILVRPQEKDQIIKRNKISISKILVLFISKTLEYYGSCQGFFNNFTQI